MIMFLEILKSLPLAICIWAFGLFFIFCTIKLILFFESKSETTKKHNEYIDYVINEVKRKEAFSDKAYDTRVTKRISLKEASERIGLTALKLSQIENGEFYPNRSIIKEMENLYGVSLVEKEF
ncbi:MAG: helix-turn-helix domain-containing protein [Treponemataceae bacterium]